VLQDGVFFEKAGVNTSKLTINVNKALLAQMRERGKHIDESQLPNLQLYANGVSLVIHPVNPLIPTIHANFRYMEISFKDTGEIIDKWFGGGSDLTPH